MKKPAIAIFSAPKARQTFKRWGVSQARIQQFPPHFWLFWSCGADMLLQLAPLHLIYIKYLIKFIYIRVQVRVQVRWCGCKQGASWMVVQNVLHPSIGCFLRLLTKGASGWIQVVFLLAPIGKADGGAGFARFGCKGASCGRVLG